MSAKRAGRAVLLAGLGTALVGAIWSASALAQPPNRAPFVSPTDPAGFDVSGSRLVWAERDGGDYDVFIYDSYTGRIDRLTSDGADQRDPAISGDTVVWTDYRNGNADVYAYDLPSGRERPLATLTGDETNPDVGPQWVVYEDYGNGYTPRVFAIPRAGGSAIPLDSGYGVRKLRPRIDGSLAVWEDWRAGDVGIRTYDFDTGARALVGADPDTEMMPDAYRKTLVWAVNRADSGFDVVRYDTATGQTTVVAWGPGDQTQPVLGAGTVVWLDRPSSDSPMALATAEQPRKRTDSPIPQRYSDNKPLARGGSIVALRGDGQTFAWLQRFGDGWRIGFSAPPTSVKRSISIVFRKLWRKIDPGSWNGVVTASDTTPPSVVRITSIRPKGPSEVEVAWTPAFETESPPVTYDLYRYKVAITSSNLASAQLVASGVSVTTSTVAAASDEASVSYTMHYAVVAKDSLGNASGPSYSLAPDPHGTSSISFNCYRCHPRAPHGGGTGWGALGAKTRYACYICHGQTSSTTPYGFGSTFNTERDSWDYSDQTSTVGSRHRNDYMESRQSECDSCHDSHRRPYYVDSTTGLYDPTRSYRRLLRVRESTDPATYLRSSDSTPAGNALCFSCHGARQVPMAIAGGPTGYVNTAGDHNESGYAGAAHAGAIILAGDANPGIQCRVCHNEHASPIDKLIDYRNSDTSSTVANYQAALCFRCHSASSAETRVAGGYSKPFSWNGRDVQSEFTSATRVSRHPITTAPTGRSATCVNCHNVHYVSTGGSAAWSASRVVDPANTKQAAPDVTSHCVGCHTTSPPAAVIGDVELVPYRVGFSPTSPWPYFTGWDKSAFTASGHYGTAGTKALCQNCHDPHASASPNLLAWTRPSGWTTGTPGSRNNTDTTLVREEKLCYQCHGNGTVGKLAPGAPDVATNMQLTYNHRPETTTGVHSSTESSGNLGGANRHNECVDCHDPHSAKRIGGTATQDSLNSSIIGGAVVGAVGVKPVFGARWTAPIVFPSVQLTGGPESFEAYLCFKCHSGNTALPGWQTNLALEFNPSNASYHNVLGQSVGMQSAFSVKASDGVTYSVTWAVPGIAVFRTGYGPNSMLTCTSCHTNETAGRAKGPHGSSVRWMLDPSYPTDWRTAGLKGSGIGITIDGSTDANGVICAKCHDLYDGKHSNDAHAQSNHNKSSGYTCTYCHVAIPHGWKRPRLLGYTDDGVYATAPTGLHRIKANDSHGLKQQVAEWSSSSCQTNNCKNHGTVSPYWP